MGRYLPAVRASRLVQLLLVLQDRGPCTAATLAGALEVSVRTVYRDVEALGEAGVPVYAERGPGGGIRLVDGYQTRLTGLTAGEADAIALLGLPRAAEQLGLGAVAVAAQAKLDASLPPELRVRARRVRERFHVDAPGWFDRSEAVPHLPALSAAVWTGARVDVRYRRGNGAVVRRRLGPLGLVLKGGTWYVLALAGRRQDVRAFRVDRVQAVAPAPGTTARPDGFVLADAWAAAERGFERAMFRLAADVRLPDVELWRLRWSLAPAAAEAALASARPDPDRSGWTRCTVPSESVEVACDELLRCGGAFEVLTPPELRSLVARTATAMLANNSGPAGAGGPPPGR